MEIFAVSLILTVFLIVFYNGYRKELLDKVTYECSFSSSEVFEGDEIEFTEIITNRKFLPVPWLKSELTVPSALEFSELSSVVTGKTRWVTSFFALRSYSRIKRTWKVKCESRGVFRIDRIIVSATDPLGLIKRYFILNSGEINAGTVTVLPVRHDYDNTEEDTGAINGDIFTKAKLICDPFYVNGIREYRITDHMKNINWFATAKNQELMVNQNDYTTDRDITVLLNIQSMDTDIENVCRPDYVEKCIRVCAGIIHDNCINGRMVRLISNDITTGEMLDVSSGDELVLLRELASVEMKIGENIRPYISRAVTEIPDSEIIVVSAFRDDEFELLKMENRYISFIYPVIYGGAA